MRVQAAITLAVAAAAPFLAPKQDKNESPEAPLPLVESLDPKADNDSDFERLQLSWADADRDNADLYQDVTELEEEGFAADLPDEEEFDENGEPLDLIEEATQPIAAEATNELEFITPAETVSELDEADASFAQSGVAEIDSILDNTRGGEEVQQAGGLEAATAMLNSVIGGEKEGEDVEPQQTIVDSGAEGGFWLRGARLNDVFQYLAQRGNLQFFHNSELEAPNFVVTGHLNDGDPFTQMEELGVMYGVTVYKKGNTVYAMNESQMAQLPTKPFQYQLRYLRANDADMAQLRTILQPVLTPGTGLIEFEPKTNTLIVIDNERRIDQVKEILQELDKPKQQIAVETRILRVTSSSRNRIGVDWTSVLGDGLSFEATSALNTLFNLPEIDTVDTVITSTANALGVGATTDNRTFDDSFSIDPDGVTTLGTATGTLAQTSQSDFSQTNALDTVTTQTTQRNGSDLVLSPLQVEAVLRALNTGNLAQQESSPTMITEDNEEGLIQIIDRIPIILTTISETETGQNITEEVRYFIDENDITDDPTSTREIGVTVTITPTILPDNTIRMKMRPRSAQVTEFITGQSGNLFPRVNESTIDTIARVPNGYSLLIGGFYEEAESDVTSKVPILGDIPLLNFAFKSTDKQKEHTSLVFIVTPKAYSPVSIPESLHMTKDLHERHVLPNDHAWPDRDKPGFNYESNLPWAVGNVIGAYPENAPSSPLHPEHPLNEMPAEEHYDASVEQSIYDLVPTSEKPRRRGLFNGLFKNKKERNR